MLIAMHPRHRHPPLKALRMRAGALLVDGAFNGLARLSKLHPRADPAQHGVEVLRDVPYTTSREIHHTLDVYRPRERTGGPLPVVLYVHGGGFRILSKDTHWMMGLRFARHGYLCFNINYRLAPRHPYPAAMQDACSALRWVIDNAERFGGDAANLSLAGESAGANLVTSLAIAATTPRPEPWARTIFDADLASALRAVLPACGLFQASDPGRFARRRKLPAYVVDRIEEVSESYLGGVSADGPGGIELADPLLLLERDEPTARPLPPFFTFVGTADPILDDTRRLAAALARRGVPCEVRYFEKEMHAFHALAWRPNARACWKESLAWLDALTGAGALVRSPPG
jgi:acetyl esterase